MIALNYILPPCEWNSLTDLQIKRAEAYLKVNVSPPTNLLVSHHGEIKARATVVPV